MASGTQIKALLQSHLERDDRRFFAVAMQLAADEARRGHGKLAQELRDLVDEAKGRIDASSPVPISRPRGELATLLEAVYPKARLADIVLNDTLNKQIGRVIREQRHAGRILEHGLSPRRKLLLMGPSGTGKTLTASILAGELGLPLLQVRLDGLITKFMGETAAKLRLIFDATHRTRGVYFFDEFDAIGSQRGLSNDVGEIRRVLNSFLQMIEQDGSHSLIVSATNHPGILDTALFRRFDDVLHYGRPDGEQIVRLLKARIGHRAETRIGWQALANAAEGLSFADITRATNEALKDAIIHGRPKLSRRDVAATLSERKEIVERVRLGSAEDAR